LPLREDDAENCKKSCNPGKTKKNKTQKKKEIISKNKLSIIYNKEKKQKKNSKGKRENQ